MTAGNNLPPSGLGVDTPSGESAVLVHGLWMHGLVFLLQQVWLERLGFAVRRFSYRSWREGLETNADRLARFVSETSGARIHLICHSLGGLVALAMLEKHPDSRIRRLVLLGTPCSGCHSGHYMAEKQALSPLLGRSMKDWFARSQPTIPDWVDIGVIAGTRPWGLGSVVIPGLPRPNDGVVTVEETGFADATDRIELPISHSGMLISPACAEQAANFLRTGQFIHA